MDYIRIFYFINKNRKKENCFISIIILTIKRMWCYTWTKIFLNYISFIRLTFCEKIHSLYNDRNIFSRVLFTFPRSISHESFFFPLPRNYYTFQEVWYASKMNHAITGPFVRIGCSLFPQWDILLCSRCERNGRLKETAKHLLPVLNFFPTLKTTNLENSSFKPNRLNFQFQKFRPC